MAIDNARGTERLTRALDALAARSADLERALSWDHRLTQVVLRGGGVDDLLREAASAATVTLRFVPAGSSRPDGVFRNPRSSRHVLAGSRDFGTLVTSGAARGDDTLPLDRLAPVLALALLADDAVAEVTRRNRDALMVELLTTPGTDLRQHHRKLRQVGLDPSERYPSSSWTPGQSTVSAHGAVEALGLPETTIVARHRGRVVVVTPHVEPNRLRERWSARPDAPTAGIDGPVADDIDLAGAYRRATETLEALLALDHIGSAATADQLGLFRILLAHAGRHELDASYDHLLGAVIAEERRRRVPLVGTVQAFLAEGRRPTLAADALGIHVNTLYQRLASIDRLLGAAWREPPRSLELQVLLLLRDGAARLADLRADVGTDGAGRQKSDVEVGLSEADAVARPQSPEPDQAVPPGPHQVDTASW